MTTASQHSLLTRQPAPLLVGSARIAFLSGLAAALVPALLTLAVPHLGAQVPERIFGYAYIVGNDTIGVERVIVHDGRWTGDIAIIGQARLVWSAVVRPSGRIATLDLSAFRAATDTAAFQVVSLTPAGDSVRFHASVPPAAPRMIPSRPDASFLVNASVAMVELLVRRAGDGSSTFPVFLTAGGQTVDVTVQRDAGWATATLAGQTTRVQLADDGSVLEGHVPAQNLRYVRLEGAALARLKLGVPNYDAPPLAPYDAEHVRISAPTGHELAATLTRPRAPTQRVPVVVTISGSGAQDRDEWIPVAGGYRPFRQIADTLGRRGVAVLRFDDRGFGGSTGDVANATTADFADDVRAILTWLRARPDVDPDHIFLLGHSEGAIIAPMVAATDSRLAGILLLAGPSRNGREIIAYQQRFAIDRDPALRTPASRDSAAAVALAALDSMVATRAWFRFLVAHDPLAVARRVSVPVLVMHGETDRQVTVEQANELASAFREGGNANVSMRVFPGLNHLFLSDPDGNPANYSRLREGRLGSEVLGAIVDWVTERFNRSRGLSTPTGRQRHWRFDEHP